MKPSKAYIIRIDTPLSKEYAESCANSCIELGIDWEYFEGVNFQKNRNGDEMWKMVKEKIKFQTVPNLKGAAAAATASHFLCWHKISQANECAIILEHDALMLNKVEIEIPENMIVALGYKVTDPENYHYKRIVEEQKIEERKFHGGAHAYALTPNTAQKLLNNVITAKTAISFIDNAFFLSPRCRGTVKLGIIDPIASIGWLRESTIWKASAVDNYDPILESFKKHYKSKKDLGIKRKK